MRVLSSGVLSASGAALPRQPGEARLGVGGGLVHKADPAPVAAAGEVGQVAVEIEPPGAGFAPAGPVGDLDVAGDAGVLGDRRVDVVAVVGQVEQVAQEADVLVARRAGGGD